MPYMEVWVDPEDNLEEYSDDDLIDELKRRGQDYNTTFVDADAMRSVLEKIWYKRRLGKDYQTELNELIYGVLGKIV
jgi:uncharacterized protein (DUF4415 family)